MILTPERVAINLDDARIKDNEGNQPIDVTIFEDGAPAYFATLPIKAMVQNMRNAGTSCQRFQHCRNLCMQPPDVWCSLHSG